jgi:hypothetical protein
MCHVFAFFSHPVAGCIRYGFGYAVHRLPALGRLREVAGDGVGHQLVFCARGV